MAAQPAGQGSLFAAIMDTIASSDPVARSHKLEVAAGFVGFFALVALVRTASASLHGVPSAPDALLAAALVGLTWLLIRRWLALDRRIADEAARARRAARG